MAGVLIVDDEKSMRVTLREFLSNEGHTTAIAKDAGSALAALRDGDFDVVLSDIILPGITGMKLLEAIREAAPGVRVIMMTGEPTVDTAARALRSGATDYLMKPFDKNQVVRSVARAAEVKHLDDQRKLLVEKNRRYREELEELVGDRTRELTSANCALSRALEDLRHTQNQVIRQERLKALGQMVSGIAHDFNNVLMPIVGLSDFLLSSPEAMKDEEETLQTLRNIRDAGNDAREIVRRLREFYKPDEHLTTSSLSLSPLCRKAVELTAPAWKAQAEAKGRRVEIHIDVPGSVRVVGNESQLREVLTNLIMNSCDAMPGGGSIRIDGRRHKKWVVLSVSDTGTGMPPEVMARCVEPFFTSKGEKGSGLGLSMCHGIVSRHGGELQIESQLGEGTTVRLRLPYGKKATAKSAPERAAAHQSVPPLSVLVVDDEMPSRALVAKFLKKAGHTVTEMDNGEHALRELREHKFDLLVTDRAMPGINGDRLAREAKQIDPDLPVVMVTGFGDLMCDSDEVPDGVDLVVPKPATPVEVSRAIAAVWNATAARREPATPDGKAREHVGK